MAARNKGSNGDYATGYVVGERGAVPVIRMYKPDFDFHRQVQPAMMAVGEAQSDLMRIWSLDGTPYTQEDVLKLAAGRMSGIDVSRYSPEDLERRLMENPRDLTRFGENYQVAQFAHDKLVGGISHKDIRDTYRESSRTDTKKGGGKKVLGIALGVGVGLGALTAAAYANGLFGSNDYRPTEPTVPVVDTTDSDLDGIYDAREIALGTNPHKLTIVAECYKQPGAPAHIDQSIAKWKSDYASKIDFVNPDGSRGIEVVGADTCTVLPAGLDFKGLYNPPLKGYNLGVDDLLTKTSLGRYMDSDISPSNPLEGREKMQIVFADFKGSGFEHEYAAFNVPRYRQIVVDPNYGLEYTSWLLSHETGRLTGLEDGEKFGENWTDVLESKKLDNEKLFGRW